VPPYAVRLNALKLFSICVAEISGYFNSVVHDCTVPKVFPISDVEPKTSSTMKLSKKKILGIIHQKKKKESRESNRESLVIFMLQKRY